MSHSDEATRRPTDIYALFREMERTSVWLGMAPGAVWVRIAPDVPHHLQVDEASLRPFLMRLAALVAVGSASQGVCVDVSVRTGPETGPGTIRLRLEIRYADSLPAGWRELGATAGISMLPEGSVLWIEIHGGIVTADQPTADVSGHVITVGREQLAFADLDSRLRERGIQITHCANADDALRQLSPRPNSEPLRAVLLDEDALPSGELHDSRETLVRRARAGGIPVYLASRVPAEDAALRRVGVTAKLSSASYELVSNLLAIAPEPLPRGAENVVQVPHWQWREHPPKLPVVLVADDVEAVRLVLARVLESLGYVAHTARSGDEALTRLMDESVHRFQAAILDISMPPGMSGPEVIRRYRARRPHSRLPMIVLTANDSRESQIAAAEAGADAFLSKPVSAESLRATLEQLLAVNTNRTEPGADEAVPELPTIDWSVLAEIERLYTSEAEVTRLIAAFSADASKRVAEIRQAAAGHNRTALCAAAQALKSLAAGIGASRLTEGARRIEELPRLPTEASMAGLIEQLQSSLSDVIAMLSGLRR